MKGLEIVVHQPKVRSPKKKEPKIAAVSEVFTFRQEELDLLFKVAKHERETIETLKRRSIRLYDLEYSGRKSTGGHHGSYIETCAFSAWLPLSAISSLDWSTSEFADLSDYPDMALSGDWSGIRDTCPEGIWEMFEVARQKLK